MDIDNIKEQFRDITGRLSERLADLTSSQRDRRAVLIGGVGLGLLILYLLLHSFSSGTSKLEKRAAQLEVDLQEIQQLRSEYQESKKKLKNIETNVKSENEALISVVEKILLKENINRSYFSIRDANSRSNTNEEFYKETSVDVDLKKVSLDDLVNILYTIKSRPSFLKVSNLTINTKFDKSDSMNVKFRVSTFEFEQVI